jgi:mannose/fructose/N-acetylgalactosamine-specific phosphotransferase system component IIC
MIYLFFSFLLFLGWSTKKILFAALIALCILGIILAIVVLVLKKLKKNKKPVASTSTSATAQAAVNKNVSPNPKYHQVPSV